MPRVARHELPWVSVPQIWPTPTGLRRIGRASGSTPAGSWGYETSFVGLHPRLFIFVPAGDGPWRQMVFHDSGT
jgi:hypothetical protein